MLDMALSFAMTLAFGAADLGTRIVVDTIGYALRLGVALLFIWRIAIPDRAVTRLVWLDWRRWRGDAIWGLGAAAVGGTLVTLLLAAALGVILLTGVPLPAPTPADRALLGSDGLLANWTLVAGIALIALVAAPVAEEVVYRGILAPPLLARFSPAAAAALNGLVFGFLHVVPYGHGGFGELEILGGVLMTVGFWLRRSLVVAVILHAAGNAYLAALAAAFVLASERWPWLFTP
jgi:membrane protease YdiL (CAAX protease family)